MNKKKGIIYACNPDLPIIKKGYPGNPVINGRFVNMTKEPVHRKAPAARWILTRRLKARKRLEGDPVTVRREEQVLDGTGDCLLWLGHSSFLIRCGSRKILIDPCLGSLPFVKRHFTIPAWLRRASRSVDCVLISHAHYDHLDIASLKRSLRPDTRLLVPLGMKSLLAGKAKGAPIQEAGWFQEYDTGFDEIRVFLLPAHHWSSRTLWDFNRVLWGSFLIITPSATIYFAGDSARTGHFRMIGGLFPEIDICLMPIGAYDPDYVMKASHMDPAGAADAFIELKGTTFIPMHYGTFELSDEHAAEPLPFLKRCMKERGLKGALRTLDIGEPLPLDEHREAKKRRASRKNCG